MIYVVLLFVAQILRFLKLSQTLWLFVQNDADRNYMVYNVFLDNTIRRHDLLTKRVHMQHFKMNVFWLYLGDNDRAARVLFVQHPREQGESCSQNPSVARVLT